MDLEELRAFLAVAETGSYLSAATSTGLSRTTLRRKVDALEARVGVPLLEGTHRGIVLTDAGNALVREGRRMTQEMHAVLDAIRESSSEPDGTLRVVLPVGLPPHLLVPMYRAISAALPKLRLHTRFSEDPIKERLEGIDVAAHFGERSPGTVWLSYAMFPAREWLVASPEYLAARGTPKTLRDLAAHDLLVWQGPEGDPHALPLRDGGFLNVAPRMVSTDAHMLRQTCLAGLGIAYLIDAELPDPDAKAPLVPLFADRVGRQQIVRLSVPRALAEVPKIRLLLEQLRAFAGAEAG